MHRLLPILCTCAIAAPTRALSATRVTPASDAERPARPALVEPPTAQAAGPPLYEVRVIARSQWGLAVPYDINNRGVIVGQLDWGPTFAGPRHAVVWKDGELIDLTPDDAIVIAGAQAINDQGVVAGFYVTDGAYYSGGFRWHDGQFDVLPTFAPGHQRGYGVTERGYVLGYAMHEHFKINATVWDPDLNDLDLGTFAPGIGVAHDSNGWDAIVGSTGKPGVQSTAFLWSEGQMYDLGALPGYSKAWAAAINNHHEVVGYCGTILGDHGFYWSRETGMIDLGNLGYGYGAGAADINEEGVIVGYTYGPHGRVAAVWHDLVLSELNKLLINGQGWNLVEAMAINELGQIVGIAQYKNRLVAYLATPVDVPMTTAIGPTPGRAGETNTIEVVAATPGAELRVYYGLTLGGTPVDGCPGTAVEIADAHELSARADAHGRATVELFVPQDALGRRFFFQAVDLSNCDVTNLVVRTMD